MRSEKAQNNMLATQGISLAAAQQVNENFSSRSSLLGLKDATLSKGSKSAAQPKINASTKRSLKVEQLEAIQNSSLIQKQYDIFKHLEHSQSQKHQIAVISLDESSGTQTSLTPQLQYQEQETKSVQNSPQRRTPRTEGCPINVIARVRPLIPNEQRHPVCIEVVDDSVIDGNKTQIIVRSGVPQKKQVEQKVYSFEKVLDPDSTQQNVFTQVEGDSLCSAFLNGQNCTVFVYGPTSTGKTFTMQGNAEDIIHGKETAKSFNDENTLNGSQDLSQIIQTDEQSFSTEAKAKGSGAVQSATKRISLNLIRRDKETSSLQQKRLSDCSYSIDIPGHVAATKPSIGKISRDMMEENRHKGIIQRVIDQIYHKFSSRQELEQNCEIKISFLEIYKENVTDLLEVHNAQKQSQRKLISMKMQKIQSTQVTSARKVETPDNHSEVSSNRGKSKTFYGKKDFEDSMFGKRQKMESGNQSPYIQHEQERLFKDQKTQSNRDLQRVDQKQRYEVRENAIKGVYVQNLSEIVCETAEQAYNCLLEGLKRKKMSQTARNTSSSRSHTIFQIKMYMKQESVSNLLLPQYVQEKETESKIVSKFCLIDLAGSERMTEADTNSELIDEARYINKSLSALGNVVAALRTQSKQTKLNQNDKTVNSQRRSSSFHSSRISINPLGGDSNRRSSFYADRRSGIENVVTHVPFRDSKLTHILKDCLGSNSFTHLIICLSPSYLCLAESISTLAFTKNAKAVRQNIVENHQFKSDMAQRNLNAQKDKDRIAQPVSSRQQSGAMYLLNKMSGGNDEEEVMLRSFLSELGYSQFSNMSIKQLFQLTLQQVKKLTDEHHDMNKKIEEMKNAMDADLSNPKTLELITNARSESINDKNNPSITNLSDIPIQEMTPRSIQNSEVTMIDFKLTNSSPTKSLFQPISNRNSNLASLNSIKEESTLTINSPTLSKKATRKKLQIKIDISGMTPQQVQSSTSVLTFGGKLDSLKAIQSQEDQDFEKDLDEILNEKSGLQQLYASNSDGKRLSEQHSESYQVTETEVSDIIDETTICGQQQLINTQRTIIPEQNLMQLKQKFQIKTMLAIISTHLKAIIQKRLKQSRLEMAKQRSNYSSTTKHYRQRSSDAAASATLWQCTRQTSNQSVTKRVAEVQSDIKKLLHSQTSISPDKEFNSQINYAFSYQMREGNKNSNNVFQQFAPKLVKSSSCPIQRLDENQKEVSVQEEQKSISPTKVNEKNFQQNFFNHQNDNKVKEKDHNILIENTDICSSDDSDEGYQDIGLDHDNIDSQKESENGSVSADMRGYNSTPKRQSDRFKFATPIVNNKKPKPYKQDSIGSHQSQSSNLHKNYKNYSLDKKAFKTTSSKLIEDYAGANFSQISGSNHHSNSQSKLIKESPGKLNYKQSMIRVIQLNSPEIKNKKHKGGLKDFKTHIMVQNKQVADVKLQQQNDILAFEDVNDNLMDHNSNLFERIKKSQNFMLSSSSAANKCNDYSDNSYRHASDEQTPKQQRGSNYFQFPRPSISSNAQQNDETQLYISSSQKKQHNQKMPIYRRDLHSSQQGNGYNSKQSLASPSQVSHSRETLNSKKTPASLKGMMINSTLTKTPYRLNSQEKLSEVGTKKRTYSNKFNDPRMLKANSVQKGGTDNKYLQSHRVRSSLYIGIPNLQSPNKLLSPTLKKTQTKDDRNNYSNSTNHGNLGGLSKLLSPQKPSTQYKIQEHPYRNNDKIIQHNQNNSHSKSNSKHVSRPNKQGASGFKISKPMAGSKPDLTHDL